MEEKYKSIFKKLGIAGFMFFLIKGIMWLIFGTALIKWLKGLMVTSAILCFPLLVYCQTSSQDSLKNYFFKFTKTCAFTPVLLSIISLATRRIS